MAVTALAGQLPAEWTRLERKNHGKRREEEVGKDRP